MSPEIAARVIALYRQSRPATPKVHNYKTAAVELGVSINTISFRVRHIYDKLQVHTKSEAMAKALRNQITK